MKGLANKRKEKGLTQKQCAAMFGLPYRTYLHYEYGRREPKYELLKRFADFFGCTIDELL
jgi:transcriptional regulator with XRE-family HTH domain